MVFLLACPVCDLASFWVPLPFSRSSSMVPPVNIIQQQPSSAGRILAQISRHSNPAQVSGTNWAPGTRPPFTPQVAKYEPSVQALSPHRATGPSHQHESTCFNSLAEQCCVLSAFYCSCWRLNSLKGCNTNGCWGELLGYAVLSALPHTSP